MKKIITILLFTFTFSLSASFCKAQFNTYHQFPDSNAVWGEDSMNCSCGDGCEEYGYNFIVNGDTIVNGLTYHKVYQNAGYWFNSCGGGPGYSVYSYSNSFFGAYREDTMKHIYACCTSYLHSHDSLLYDFNLNVGDTLKQFTVREYSNSPPVTVFSIDSLLIGSNYRKQYNLAINGDTDSWTEPSIIEGIGSTEGLFDIISQPFEVGSGLLCFSQNGKELWSMSSNDSCSLYYLGEGIPTIEKPSSTISVSPNPSNGRFIVSFSHPKRVSGSQTITIYNILGESVLKETLRSTQGDNLIDMSNQPNGVYLFRVLNGSGELIGEGKLVVQK
jgi:hypothetical protein